MSRQGNRGKAPGRVRRFVFLDRAGSRVLRLISIAAYEKRIGKLEREKVLMEEKSVTADMSRFILE